MDELDPVAKEGRIPESFLDYLKSLGPGIIMVLTWLGAGDIVEVAVSGGNYGYALMWAIALALLVRYLFVSLIAKYQLANQHGEGVLDGLARLNPLYAPVLLVTAVLMGHVYASYMIVGVGEISMNLTGIGKTWHWAIVWNAVALVLIFRPEYETLEWIFKGFLGLLSVGFIGCALWVGPDPGGIVGGVLAFDLPDQVGPFESLFVAVSMMGAVGGSVMNLVYPYFLEQKGWHGPKFVRVQRYELLLSIIAMIVLNLSVWVLGAELVHPRGLTIEGVNDIPVLLSEVIGSYGRILFYLGLFSAIYTSLIGHVMGMGTVGAHAFERWDVGESLPARDFSDHRIYRRIVVWCLLSSLVWTVPGMPGFVALTLIGSSLNLFLVPLLAGGIWAITALSQYVGEDQTNSIWENAVMALVLAVSLWAMGGLIQTISDAVSGMM